MQPLVLAIEPDVRQAAIVKRIVREKVLAEVAVVDSRDAALAAIRTAVPDVLLLSALLSPRDEDELIAHLRTLEQAQHLQTHTIPQLASSIGGSESGGGRGLLGAFKRKKSDAVAAGCDPDLFAEEIKSYLRQASRKKRELQELAESGHAPAVKPAMAAVAATASPSPDQAVAPPPASSWESPFEWKPRSNPSSFILDQRIVDPESRIADPIPDPILDPILDPSPDRSPDRSPDSSEIEIPAVEARRERRPLETVNLWHDSGFTIQDEGFADKGLRISDSILSGRTPEDVAAVSYASGCRVRRVRVAAAA